MRVCGGVGEDSDGVDGAGELVELPELLASVVDAAEGVVVGANVDAVRVCGGVGEDSDGEDGVGELVELPELFARCRLGGATIRIEI